MTKKVITGLILTVILANVRCRGAETVHLVSRRSPYSLSAAWTVQNYGSLPYKAGLESSRFPRAERTGTVPWFFRFDGHQTLNLRFDILMKPANVLQIYASSECSIIDHQGRKRHTVYGDEKPVVVDYRSGPSGWLLDLNLKEKLANESAALLPNGHLTIRCDINGFLVCNETTKTDVISEIRKKVSCVGIYGESDTFFEKWIDEATTKDFDCHNQGTPPDRNCLEESCKIVLKYRNTCN